MRVCDWIAQFFADKGISRVYGLTGGGASGLNDGFISCPSIKYLCFHHEAAATYAATADAKFTGNPAVVNPTTGCGGTNCMTGLLDAWQDSVPVIFVSGNVKQDDLCVYKGVRKYGIQDANIIQLTCPITKFSKIINNVGEVKLVFELAWQLATSDRPGPVWIDIPANIQTAEFKEPDVEAVKAFWHYWENNSAGSGKYYCPKQDISFIGDAFVKAQRPIVLAGQGIRLAKQVRSFKDFVEDFDLPYVSTFGARDLLPFDHPLNIGAIGIKGSRAGNYAMQHADLLLILGCSLNNSHIGYDRATWAPKARKIWIDIDRDELNKHHEIELVHMDLNTFFFQIGQVE